MLQSFLNKQGIIVSPTALRVIDSVIVGTVTLDAAGESITYIGKINLEAGSGSKTLSSAGGKIYWRVSSVSAFADAGTTLRIGVGDVGTGGIETGTLDVYDDLVGGTDTITANSINTATMSTGTKSITHGDLVAISIEMTARGGSDSLVIQKYASGVSNNFPYITVDSGSGPAGVSDNPSTVLIEFDDGTLGWLDFSLCNTFSPTSFSSSSTPDEYALIFKVPMKCSIIGGSVMVGSIASTDDFEIILYSDPLGTPVAERTVAIDADLTWQTSTARAYNVKWSSYTLEPDTYYAIALRPTTTNSIQIVRSTIPDEKFRKQFPFGTNISEGTRSDQTGAFSETTTSLPVVTLIIDQLDDGASSGGGGFFIQ